MSVNLKKSVNKKMEMKEKMEMTIELVEEHIFVFKAGKYSQISMAP